MAKLQTKFWTVEHALKMARDSSLTNFAQPEYSTEKSKVKRRKMAELLMEEIQILNKDSAVQAVFEKSDFVRRHQKRF